MLIFLTFKHYFMNQCFSLYSLHKTITFFSDKDILSSTLLQTWINLNSHFFGVAWSLHVKICINLCLFYWFCFSRLSIYFTLFGSPLFTFLATLLHIIITGAIPFLLPSGMHESSLQVLLKLFLSRFLFGHLIITHFHKLNVSLLYNWITS